MAIRSDEVFVIKTTNFKESDYIVTLLGRESGKFSGIAKGARKAKSKFGGVFNLLNLSEVVFYQGSKLDFISEAEVLRSWEGIKSSSEAIEMGLRCARTLNRLLEDKVSQKGIFNLFELTLSSLEDNQNQLMVLELGFYLKLFWFLGYYPRLEECGRCGTVLDEEKSIWFLPKKGVVYCDVCGSGEGMLISGGLRKKLLKLFSLPQNRVRLLKVSSQQLKKSFILLKRFARFHFDREVVKVPFLTV